MIGTRGTGTPPFGTPLVPVGALPAPRSPRADGSAPHLDAVTGLIGERQFGAALDQHLRRASRAPCAGSVLIVDIDRFHELNEDHGHEFGDVLLREVGASIGRRLRDSDVLARVGGDQFAVLLWAVAEAGALKVGEDLIALISRVRVGGPAGPAGMTASVGLVVLDATLGRSEAIMGAARGSLARAKAAGGNSLAMHA